MDLLHSVMADLLLTHALNMYADLHACHVVSSTVDCALIVPPWAIALAVFIALVILGIILLALLKLIVYLLVSDYGSLSWPQPACFALSMYVRGKVNVLWSNDKEVIYCRMDIFTRFKFHIFLIWAKL